MEKASKQILIVGGDPGVDWKKVFAGARVEVTQVQYEQMTMVSYSDGTGCVVTVPGQSSSLRPDIALIRGAARGAYGCDNRSVLLCLAFGGVRCVNSSESLERCSEKPLVHAVLQTIRKRLGHERFPLIDQAMFANWKAMTFADGFPVVAKVGTCHAGLGKMKVESLQQFHDLRSVLALQHTYVTTEPFVDWDYDWRLQKIGPHVRGFRRTSDCWKGAGLASRDEDAAVTDVQRVWLDEVSAALGMDILSIDGVHGKDGRDWIIEVNDSAVGLNSRWLDDDLQHIRDLVLSKLELPPPSSSPSSSSTRGDVSRVDDPTSIALEHARAEITQLRQRIEQLEKQQQQQQQQQQSASGQSVLSRLFKK